MSASPVADSRTELLVPAEGSSIRATLANFLLSLTLGILVLFPIFQSGYLIGLDVTFGPLRPFASRFWDTSADAVFIVPLEGLFSLLNHGVFRPLIGKLFLLLTLTGAGLSVAFATGRASFAGRTYAMVLFVVNPWVYERLSVGQIGIVAGYALLPLAITLTIRLLTRPTLAVLCGTSIVYAFVGVVAPRELYLLCFAFGVFLVWKLSIGERTIVAIRRGLLWTGGLVSLLVLLLLYWIAALITLPSGLAARRTDTDLTSFATQTDPDFGIVFNTAALYGLWREIDPIKNHLYGWWILACLIFVVAMVGFLSLWSDRRHRWKAGSLITIWVLAMFVAMGVSFEPTRPLWMFLFDNLPGFNVFREPQKATAFLVLVYALLGAVGVDHILKWWPLKSREGGLSALTLDRLTTGLVRCLTIVRAWVHPNFVLIVLLILPLLYGYREFAGLWGRLQPREYPPSWYAAAEFLEHENHHDDGVLFLPWHQYMAFPFTGNRTVANPAPVFFPGRIIRGDNIEAGPISSQSSNPVSSYIEELLLHPSELQNFGNLMVPLGVRYVLLSMNADSRRYGFLDQSLDLELVGEWDDLKIYKNLRPVSRFYTVSVEVTVQDISELIQVSHERDLGGALYLVGNDSDRDSLDWASTSAVGMHNAIDYKKLNPLSYQVDVWDGRWLIFTDPYRYDWMYGEEHSVRNVGAVNAFPATPENSTISIPGSRLRLIAYGISLLTLFIGVAVILRAARQKTDDL